MGHRQAKYCAAAGNAIAVAQGQGAAVILRDLPAKNEADSTARGLRREKGNKEIPRLRDSRSVIVDPDQDGGRVPPPAEADSRLLGTGAALLERGIDRILDQVDQRLLYLGRVTA